MVRLGLLSEYQCYFYVKASTYIFLSSQIFGIFQRKTNTSMHLLTILQCQRNLFGITSLSSRTNFLKTFFIIFSSAGAIRYQRPPCRQMYSHYIRIIILFTAWNNSSPFFRKVLSRYWALHAKQLYKYFQNKSQAHGNALNVISQGEIWFATQQIGFMGQSHRYVVNVRTLAIYKNHQILIGNQQKRSGGNDNINTRCFCMQTPCIEKD